MYSTGILLLLTSLSHVAANLDARDSRVKLEIMDCQLELAKLYLGDKGYRLGEHLELYSGKKTYDLEQSLGFLTKLSDVLQEMETRLRG